MKEYVNKLTQLDILNNKISYLLEEIKNKEDNKEDILEDLKNFSKLIIERNKLIYIKNNIKKTLLGGV